MPLCWPLLSRNYDIRAPVQRAPIDSVVAGDRSKYGVTGRGQAFWSKIVFRHQQTNGFRRPRGRKVPIRSEARIANGNIIGMALNP